MNCRGWQPCRWLSSMLPACCSLRAVHKHRRSAKRRLPGLIPQLVVAADKRADGDGLVDIAVQSDKTDTTAVSSPVVRFYFRDQLHGPHLGCSREGTGREGIEESTDAVGTFIECATHPRDQVDHMRIELRLLIEIDFTSWAWRLRSFRARSTSITCSAFSLGSFSRNSTAFLSSWWLPLRLVVPAMGSMLICDPLILQCVSGDEPKIRYPPKSK